MIHFCCELRVLVGIDIAHQGSEQPILKLIKWHAAPYKRHSNEIVVVIDTVHSLNEAKYK